MPQFIIIISLLRYFIRNFYRIIEKSIMTVDLLAFGSSFTCVFPREKSIIILFKIQLVRL